MVEHQFPAVLFFWSPPQDLNGVIIAYEITYKVNCNEQFKTNTTNVTTSYRLELLSVATIVCDASVRAYTRAGPGKASPHLNVSAPTIQTCETKS